MSCEIDYCEGGDDKVLTINTADEVIQVRFCQEHAAALEARLVGLIDGDIRGIADSTIGEVNAAIEYLDVLAAANYDRGN